ncbi:patellin-3 [Prunus yedoensis var. nudiflora]|uniref:Patellin-3 n=1 Tax=Prunus yedoensis var. nudiflora TaxID=2094558 RepID=A0A314XLU2_PRUYE|nr:patellin-3 [Prunus yedoensis var. nudiflora]
MMIGFLEEVDRWKSYFPQICYRCGGGCGRDSASSGGGGRVRIGSWVVLGFMETEAKEQEPLPPPPSLPEVTESEKEELPPPVAAVVESESEEKTQKEEPERKQIPRSLISFKEESNIVADLSDSERKALQELKQLVQEALNSHQFTSPKLQETQEKAAAEAPPLISESETKPTHEPKIEENPLKEAEEVAKEATQLAVPPEEVSIWGVPLLKDDRSDVILLKF